MDPESPLPESSEELTKLVVHWRRAAEDAGQLCLEQMEAVRQAQLERQDVEHNLVVLRQTVASQQSELSDLRRNLERSTGIIRTLEQRLSTLQENLAQRESQPHEAQLEAQLGEAQALLREREREAGQKQAQLSRANERLIALERQLMQLKGVMDRAVFGRSQPLLPVPETAPADRPGTPQPTRYGHVQLPAFLQSARSGE